MTGRPQRRSAAAKIDFRKLAGEEAESSEAESSNENPDPSSHHEDGEVEDAAQDLWDLDIMDSPFPEVRPRDKEFCCLVCGAQSSNVLDINGPSDLLMLSLFPAFGPLATSSFSSVSSLCLSCNETWSRIADQIQALKEKKDAEAKKLESSSAQTRDRESDLKGKCLVCVICSGHVSKEGRGYNIYRHKVPGTSSKTLWSWLTRSLKPSMLVLLKKRAKRSDLACRDCRDNLARIAAMDFQSSRIKSKIGGLLRVVSLQMKERRKEKKSKVDVKGTGVDEEGNLATAVETFLKSRVEIRVLSQDGKSLNKMRQRGRKENFLIEEKEKLIAATLQDLPEMGDFMEQPTETPSAGEDIGNIQPGNDDDGDGDDQNSRPGVVVIVTEAEATMTAQKLNDGNGLISRVSASLAELETKLLDLNVGGPDPSRWLLSMTTPSSENDPEQVEVWSNAAAAQARKENIKAASEQPGSKERLNCLTCQGNPAGTLSAILRHVVKSDCALNCRKGSPSKKRFGKSVGSISKARQAGKRFPVPEAGNKIKSCEICQKVFQKSDQLEVHLRIHAGQKPFPCEICGKAFTRKASMLEHVARHKGMRDKLCEICNKRFYATSYWRHMATVHAKEEKLTFSCRLCDRKFAQQFRLIEHEKSHLAYEQREFVCNKCPEKRFSTINRLSAHEKLVHTIKEEEGSKLCPDCGMTFQSVSALTGHRKRQHLDKTANRFECEECSMTFTSATALRKHLHSVHLTPSNSYECKICNDSEGGEIDATSGDAKSIFKKKADLLSHIRDAHESSSSSPPPPPSMTTTTVLAEDSTTTTIQLNLPHQAEVPSATSTSSASSTSLAIADSTKISDSLSAMKKEQEFEGMASSLDQQARDLFVPPSLQEDLKEGESRGNSDSVQQTQHYPRPDAVPEGILISAEQLRGLVVHAPAAAEPGMSEFKASPSVRDVVLDVVPAADSRPELDPNSSVTEFFAIDGLNQGSAGDLDDQTGGPGLQQVLVRTAEGDFLLPIEPGPSSSAQSQELHSQGDLSQQPFLDQTPDTVTLAVVGAPLEGAGTQCPKCGKEFQTAKAMLRHSKMIHSTEVHPCLECGRNFGNSKYLKEHMKIHTDIKLFQCLICDKSFKFAKDLTRHNRTHTGEKPYQCPDCPKSFSHSSNLSEHRSIHTGKMKYSCEKCMKQFRLWSTYRKHQDRCRALTKASPSASLGNVTLASAPQHEPLSQGQQQHIIISRDTIAADEGDITQVLVLEPDGTEGLEELIQRT